MAIVLVSQLSCTSISRSVEKGETSLRLGDYSMAIRFFEEVLIREPENFNARLGMGKALIQQASAKGGDSLAWSRAITHLDAARSIKPDGNVEPLLSDAWMVQTRRRLDSRDTISALGALSRSIDLNPRSTEALNLAGIIYFKIGEPAKARILFERALAIDSLKSFTHFNLGMLCWSADDFAGSYKAWFKALQLAPDDKDIVYWYSVAEKKLREPGR